MRIKCINKYKSVHINKYIKPTKPTKQDKKCKKKVVERNKTWW